jgi:chemotaxis protein CheD
MNELKVGIGEVKVEQGQTILAAYGVGSCVVIILYCVEKQIGGLAHCLLPQGNGTDLKYPKNAIAEMLKQMEARGALREKLTAKIVGGATMFEGFARQAIGKRNVKEAQDELNGHNIPVIAEDVFGNWGRSIRFNLETGEVRVKSFTHGEKIL